MNVLLLTGVFSPCPQSASQRVTSFAQSLSSERFQSIVLTSSRCLKKQRKPASDQNVLIYDLNSPRFLLSISAVVVNPVLLLLYLFMSIVITIDRSIDVILASVPNGETAIAGFLLSKMFKVPLVIDVRDLYPPSSEEFPFLYLHVPSWVNEVFIRFFRFLYRNSDGVVCVDTAIRDELVKHGVGLEKTIVITNGADTSIYSLSHPKKREEIRLKWGLLPDKFVFVYAGSLVSYYPVADTIFGAKKLFQRRSDFQLLVISHMNYDSYETTVEKLGLMDVVRFLGPLSAADTAEILSACDVGVVTYRAEDIWKNDYGAKIFSYMSCGLPVIASGPFGSVIQNLIQEHRVGLFIGKPNGDNFCTGYKFFLNNRREAKTMGYKARKTVEAFYDRRKLASKLVLWIDQLCIKGEQQVV